MRAAVTERVGLMEVKDRPQPPDPGPGQVMVRPLCVGLCGSDFHFYSGHLSDQAGGSNFPRVQGHEVSAAIEAVGDGCRDDLQPGRLAAVMPISSCGQCYPCRAGRPSVCVDFRLIGIHVDGGLQEHLVLPQAQVFPVDRVPAPVAALSEPVSIGVRTVRRGRVEAGERVVVFGAGPIGQAVSVAAQDVGADVMMIDRLEARLRLARELGAADTVVWSAAEDVVACARAWTDGEGAPVVVDCTGVPEAVRAGVDVAASAGRMVQVGMSTHQVSLRVGSFTEKELDMLGVCCMTSEDFGGAVELVQRRAAGLERLISHDFPLERAREGLLYAMEHPADVMKVMIAVTP